MNILFISLFLVINLCGISKSNFFLKKFFIPYFKKIIIRNKKFTQDYQLNLEINYFLELQKKGIEYKLTELEKLSLSYILDRQKLDKKIQTDFMKIIKKR